MISRNDDLTIGAAAGVKVRPALPSPDRQAGQRILEYLLEAKKLDDPKVHRRIESDAALVRPERGVEVHPEASVNLDLVLVVNPRYAEDNLPLGLANTLN